jgi:hypothetical protein
MVSIVKAMFIAVSSEWTVRRTKQFVLYVLGTQDACKCIDTIRKGA